jgi:hypothetical protein
MSRNYRHCRWQAGLAAASLVSLAILATGCSSGSSGSDPNAASASDSATLTQALKYTACMRSHGIADFPDPNSQGQINITLRGPDSDLAPTNPKYIAAETACKSLQPPGLPLSQQEEDYPGELRYAQCMRGRGIDVPDPRAPGSGSGPGSQSQSGSGSGGGEGTNSSGVNNPNSPQFIAANKACEHYLPAGSQGPSTNLNGDAGS